MDSYLFILTKYSFLVELIVYLSSIFFKLLRILSTLIQGFPGGFPGEFPYFFSVSSLYSLYLKDLYVNNSVILTLQL